MKDKIILFPNNKIKKENKMLEEDVLVVAKERPLTDPGLVKAAWELYYWQYAQATNFTAQLFSLIAKADIYNRGRIMRGFQDEVIVFTMWEASETPKVFFDMFNIKIGE